MIKLIYPGSNIWIKRARHLTVLCTISVTLFLNHVQTRLFETGVYIMDLTESGSGAVVASAEYTGEAVERNITAIEQSRYGWILNYFPKTDGMKGGIGELRVFQDKLSYMSGLLNAGATILQWTSIALWVTVGFSALWLLLDLIFGQRRKIVLFLLLLSGVVNMLVHIRLYGIFENTF